MLKTDEQSYLNFINGRWKSTESGETKEVRNPADRNDVVGIIQRSTIGDVNEAIASAKAAKERWRKLSGNERGNYLYKVANILESRLDDVAETLTREMGKTLPEAKGETARGVAILRYYAGEGLREVGDVIPSTDSKGIMYTTRAPLGVVGVITPWNFPVAIPIWKIAPALIYGNTVVIKPATEAAATAAKVIECFAEAGLPNGVINMVTGSGSIVGNRIAEHPDVNGVTFTGSDQTGKHIGQTALARGAKYQLEMGGKNPVIVAEDADLDLAVQATISGGLSSTGQKCTATSRVIVQSAVYEDFKERLLKEIQALTVGNGLKVGSWMGPSVSESQLETVLSYIEKGKEEGATLLTGGNRLTDAEHKDGNFVEPTVFEDVSNDMTIAQEEIFGPVLALIKVETFEEAMKLANDTEYGLSAAVFTENIRKMLTFIDDIEVGLVRVNAETAGVELQAPFGGMKSSSSHSREQGKAAIEFFTSIKTVFIK